MQAALERLRTTGEPGLGVIEPIAPAAPAAAAVSVAPSAEAGPVTAPAPQAADDSVTAAELEYVLNELTSEGYAAERITVERALELSRMFVRTTAQP